MGCLLIVVFCLLLFWWAFSTVVWWFLNWFAWIISFCSVLGFFGFWLLALWRVVVVCLVVA